MKQQKRYLRELFRQRGIFAERKLGQCFLVDGNLQDYIVRQAALTKDDLVLEVGAGTGQLTSLLAERAGRVLSVEIDAALYDLAREHCVDADNLLLVNADVLAGKNRINPAVLDPLADLARSMGGYHLVANLPYYVALPVMLNLCEEDVPWVKMLVTVQKEFATKLAAGPGQAGYGAATLFFQCWARARILRTLPPQVFWPRPAVDSAILEAHPRRKLLPGIEYRQFKEFVRHLFSQRRKKLANSVASYGKARDLDGSRALAAAGVDGDLRPETLSLETFMEIFLQLTA